MTEKSTWRLKSSLLRSQNKVEEKIQNDKEKLEKLSSKITEIEPEKDFARSISSIEDSRLKYCQKDRGWSKILLVFTAHKIRIGNLRLQFRQGLTDYTYISMITNIDLRAQFRYTDVPDIQSNILSLSSENNPLVNAEFINDNIPLRTSDNTIPSDSSSPLSRSVDNNYHSNNDNHNKSNHNSPVRMSSASNQLLQGGIRVNNSQSQPRGSASNSPNIQQSPARLNNNQASFIIVGDFGVKDKPHLGFSAVRNEILSRIHSDDVHYTVHLGDVYYAGTICEEQLFENIWLTGSLGSFALNSNHEMYSGAKGFQKVLLRSPKLALQKNNHSFLLENDFWMIVGLDSAVLSSYSSLFGEGRIKDPMQVEMLNIARKSMKKIIILTHHNPVQYNGRFTTRLWDDVYKILRREPHYWYFGHEHNAIAYKVGIAKTKLTRFRCAGHGAIPYRNAPIFDKEESIFWREKTLAKSELLPERLCNGFITLQLDDDRVIEAYVNELGQEMLLPDPAKNIDLYLPQNDYLRVSPTSSSSQPSMEPSMKLSRSGSSIDDLDHHLKQIQFNRDCHREANQEKRRFWKRKTSSPVPDSPSINVNSAIGDNYSSDSCNPHLHQVHINEDFVDKDGSKERGIADEREDQRSFFRKKINNINANNTQSLPRPTRHRRNKSDTIRPTSFSTIFSNFQTPQTPEKKKDKEYQKEKELEKKEKKDLGEKEKSGISSWFDWRDRENKGSKEIQKDQRRHRRGTSRDLDRERDII